MSLNPVRPLAAYYILDNLLLFILRFYNYYIWLDESVNDCSRLPNAKSIYDEACPLNSIESSTENLFVQLQSNEFDFNDLI